MHEIMKIKNIIIAMMIIVIQIDGKSNKVNDYANYSSVGHHITPPQWPTTRMMRGAWENGHGVLNE